LQTFGSGDANDHRLMSQRIDQGRARGGMLDSSQRTHETRGNVRVVPAGAERR
jgi:hypothetical protein